MLCLLLVILNKNHQKIRVVGVSTQLNELRALFNIFSTLQPMVGFSPDIQARSMGVESQQQNTRCAVHYKYCFLILQSDFSLI